MTAWMQMWDRSFPTAPHGWVGALTLPRELTYRDGKLFQAPVREIEAYRTDRVSYPQAEVDGTLRLDGVEGNTIELSFDLDLGASARAGVKVFCGDGWSVISQVLPGGRDAERSARTLNWTKD